MSLFDKLPSDVVGYMSLYLDMPSVLSFGQTCHRFHQTVLSNEYFWRNRLRCDYGLDEVPETLRSILYDELQSYTHQPYTPKTYYQDMDQWFSRDQNPNDEYVTSVGLGRLDLVKASFHRGANIHYGGESLFGPSSLIQALRNKYFRSGCHGRDDIGIFKYLLNKGFISSMDQALKILVEIRGMYHRMIHLNMTHNKEELFKLFSNYMVPCMHDFTNCTRFSSELDKTLKLFTIEAPVQTQ